MSKKIVSLVLSLLLLLNLTAATADGITVTDMFGREVTLTEPAARVVALEPGDCEILCALGCGDTLVGRGMYCDYPASVLDLPAVQTGGSLNVEELLALNPQVVIMSGMFHLDEQLDVLERNGVKVIGTDANSISEVYDAIRLIARVTGKDAEAEAVISDMQTAFDSIAAQSEQTDKTIYFEVMPLEWGLWSAGTGTFMHELAEMCGMQNAFADIDGWQAISQEQVIERDPDYIVLVTGMGETAAEEVMNRAGWSGVKAIQNGKVYNADSYALTRPAPRLKDAAMDLFNFLNDPAAAD